VRRRGRALILAHGVGVVALAALALPMQFTTALVLVYFWGASGGVAMSMARTIMQELATDQVRGRVMAFFSVSFMGAGPVGALLSGTLVHAVGVHNTLLIVSVVMAVVLAWAGVATALWRFDPHRERAL
jgi:MFS family permease